MIVENTLAGVPGDPVTNASLAASAGTGTVTVASPGAVYDTAHTVHGKPTIRLDSGYHRLDSPRLHVTVPGTWAARWYLRHPTLYQETGSTNEVRWHIRMPGGATGMISSESPGGFLVFRSQPDDLAAGLTSGTGAGSSVAVPQWVRVEVRSTPTTTEIRLYPGHTPDNPRVLTWPTGQPGGTLSISGFRFLRRATLQWGSQGSAVTTLQTELIDLGYDLSPWGADGDFGELTHTRVMDFQTDYGLSPVDGAAGPETRAAMDLALGRIPSPLWISHLAVSDGDWIGPAEPPPEPAHRRRLHVGYLPI